MIRHGDELKAVTNASPQLPVDAYVSSLAVSPRGLVVGGRGLLLILDRDGRAVPTQDYSGATKGRRVISLAVDELGAFGPGSISGTSSTFQPTRRLRGSSQRKALFLIWPHRRIGSG